MFKFKTKHRDNYEEDDLIGPTNQHTNQGTPFSIVLE